MKLASDTRLAKELQRTRLIVCYDVFAIELCPIVKAYKISMSVSSNILKKLVVFVFIFYLLCFSASRLASFF